MTTKEEKSFGVDGEAWVIVPPPRRKSYALFSSVNVIGEKEAQWTLFGIFIGGALATALRVVFP